jgi:uncharacterized membrane-anchored protein
VKRLERGDIAVIDHVDMDRVSAEELLDTGVEVVVNAARSISGSYPNEGPLLLVRAGVVLLDDVGQDVFERVGEGDEIDIVGGDVLIAGEMVASGRRLSVVDIESAMTDAATRIDERLDAFVANTMEFIDKERGLLMGPVSVPVVRTHFDGRHALVVVRGHDYKDDLRTLVPYVREMKPVLIGVDGGADALLERGLKPDVIVGDMDSVSDEVLGSGAELIVHAYADGRCPGEARLRELGLEGTSWAMAGTSEDLALLLAYEAGAELIVAVGTHANLIEHLDKGRKGAASTYLVRLKVGPKLVDAKGVSKLYRASVKPSQLIILVVAALVTVTTTVLISPQARTLVSLLVLKLRATIGL